MYNFCVKKSTLARFTRILIVECQSCRTCNCVVSWWRPSTVLFNSARSLSAGSGCGENLFTISRTLSYDPSRQSRSAIHMLYAIRAGMERSIVATLFLSSRWRPIRSHRRSSISDVTFANGESVAFVKEKSLCFYLILAGIFFTKSTELSLILKRRTKYSLIIYNCPVE